MIMSGERVLVPLPPARTPTHTHINMHLYFHFPCNTKHVKTIDREKGWKGYQSYSPLYKWHDGRSFAISIPLNELLSWVHQKEMVGCARWRSRARALLSHFLFFNHEWLVCSSCAHLLHHAHPTSFFRSVASIRWITHIA